MEIDHEVISTAIYIPSADSKRVVLSYRQKYKHEVLVNRLINLAQEKVCLGELTVLTLVFFTIAVDWDVKHQTKPNQNYSTSCFNQKKNAWMIDFHNLKTVK